MQGGLCRLGGPLEFPFWNPWLAFCPILDLQSVGILGREELDELRSSVVRALLGVATAAVAFAEEVTPEGLVATRRSQMLQ